MELKTASSVINYISGIESQSADWYTQHARHHSNLETLFTAFAGENQKFAKRLKKAYYSGVTDALETNFSFQGLEADVEIPETADPATPGQLLALSLELEKSIRSFYMQAAALSQDLLADLPRAMERVGRAREKRIDALLALQQPM
jgi:hypothetical protein